MNLDANARMWLAIALGLTAALGNVLGGAFRRAPRMAAPLASLIFWRWARDSCWPPR